MFQLKRPVIEDSYFSIKCRCVYSCF